MKKYVSPREFKKEMYELTDILLKSKTRFDKLINEQMYIYEYDEHDHNVIHKHQIIAINDDDLTLQTKNLSFPHDNPIWHKIDKFYIKSEMPELA